MLHKIKKFLFGAPAVATVQEEIKAAPAVEVKVAATPAKAPAKKPAVKKPATKKPAVKKPAAKKAPAAKKTAE